MNVDKRVWLAPLVFVCLCTAGEGAEEYAIDHFAGVGARAMGMGGAYVAVAEDFSAVLWNPAGLAQLRRIEAYGALFPYMRQKTTSVFYGSPRSDEISKAKLGSLGVVFPYPTYRGSLVFTAGFNRVRSFDTVLSIDGYSDYQAAQVTATSQDEGDLGAFSLAGAVDISPSMSLGLAVHIWDGRDEHTQDVTQRDTRQLDPDLLGYSAHRTFSDEYDGVSVDLGAMLRGPLGLRFGATLSSPVRFRVDEEWTEREQYQNEDSTYADPASRSGTYPYHLTLPYQFGFGVSWTRPNVLVAAGFHYADWSQVEYDPGPPVEGLTNAEFRRQHHGTLRTHLGCEVLIPVINVNGRIGYYRDPFPRKEEKGDSEGLGPAFRVDNERDFLTLGAGVLIDRVLAVDVAWVSGLTELVQQRTAEERRTSRLVLSAGYRL